MGVIGHPINNNVEPMDSAKKSRSQQKRDELNADRYDIITKLEKASDKKYTPASRQDQSLLIGIPINDEGNDGMLDIGQTAEIQYNIKKQKQREYLAQLNSDQESAPNSSRISPRSPRGGSDNRDYDSMNTDRSFKNINTGITGYQIGNGPSSDMTGSMKNISFNAKKNAQAAYRAALEKQQEQNVFHKSVEASKSAIRGDDGQLPYMR